MSPKTARRLIQHHKRELWKLAAAAQQAKSNAVSLVMTPKSAFDLCQGLTTLLEEEDERTK